MKRIIPVLVLMIFAFLLNACRKNAVLVNVATTDSLKYNSDWTFASHGNAEQNYSIAFPQNTINSIEITMTAAQWSSIRTNMKSIYGNDFGVTGQMQPPGALTTTADPDYVDVLMKFNGKSWKNVGFRLKGNSTLRTAWSQGNYKLPFRLNFDKFQDTYPGIKNQHFYGFEELSFSPGFSDQSLIREKLASDVFKSAGIPAATTAFYKVFIDIGDGLKYCGVYTGVELPDDHMIKSQLGEESGNIYKPESNFTSFVQSVFEKKNNEIVADYTDVRNFVTALNSTTRTNNAAAWRTGIEAVFNMDHFIKYLAVNNAIVNWDSYGSMAHNYYLYNHSAKKLMWIPWDHNESFSGSPGIIGTVAGGTGGGPGGPPGGGGGKVGVSLSMNEVSTSWPLIRYVADDPIYLAKYKTYLKSFKENVFTEAAMNSLIDKYQNIISSSAVGVSGEKTKYTYLTSEASFNAAFTALKTHIVARRTLITSYVP